jgi:hypothetical protein
VERGLRYAAALGTPLVVVHGAEHGHALKEVDAAALAVAERPEQVVDILRYVLRGQAAAGPPERRSAASVPRCSR